MAAAVGGKRVSERARGSVPQKQVRGGADVGKGRRVDGGTVWSRVHRRGRWGGRHRNRRSGALSDGQGHAPGGTEGAPGNGFDRVTGTMMGWPP